MSSTKPTDSMPTNTERDGAVESEEAMSNCGTSDDATPLSPDSNRVQSHPWIRYSTQYRRQGTRDILHSIAHQDENDFEAANITYHNKGTEAPAFEVLAVYEISFLATENDWKPRATRNEAPAAFAKPSYFLRIYSLAIINALQAVVEYYPQHNLNGDMIELRWPYPLLVHHYDELRAFQDRCRLTDASVLCEREKDAAEHLSLLLEYLDAHIMEKVNAEKRRNSEGNTTFDYQWVSRKPGATIMTKLKTSDNWTIGVMQSCTGGIFADPPEPWKTEIWNLVYSGEYMARQGFCILTPPYDGKKEFCEIIIARKEYGNASMGEIMEKRPSVKEAVEAGQIYWNLLKPACKAYKGATWDDPAKEESGSQFRSQSSNANYYLD